MQKQGVDPRPRDAGLVVACDDGEGVWVCDPLCSSACSLIIHAGVARFPVCLVGSIIRGIRAPLPDTPRNLCDFKTINARSSLVKERGFEHEYAGNHCYEQEKDRNAE